MKFGIFTHVPWPEGMDTRQVFRNTIQEVQYAEELGFHSAWLAEHHFSRYGIGSSCLVLAGNLAAQTTRIRIGTAVLVPPLHNPIRLAEDTATVDALSDGRLDVGFGRGTANYEYRGYNVDREESQGRFQESIKVIKGLWTTPEFSHQGEYYQVNRATLVPPPVQQPPPTASWAATRTQATLEIGIALNTGQAMVGNIGSPRRMEYTVIGDVVNLTSRLQDLTKEYGVSVLISGTTYDQVKDMCEVRALGSVKVRGRQQPVSLYEVTGLISRLDINDFQKAPVLEAATVT